MIDAKRSELGSQLLALCGGGSREALPQSTIGGVHAQLPSRLGIYEVELAYVRQLLLPRVPDLDGDRLVAAGQPEHRFSPVSRTAEVGGDYNERTPSRKTGDSSQDLGRGGGAECFGIGPLA